MRDSGREREGGERAEVLTSIIVGGAIIDTPQFGVSESVGRGRAAASLCGNPSGFRILIASLSLFRHLRDRRPIMRDGSTFEEGTFSWEYVDGYNPSPKYRQIIIAWIAAVIFLDLVILIQCSEFAF